MAAAMAALCVATWLYLQRAPQTRTPDSESRQSSTVRGLSVETKPEPGPATGLDGSSAAGRAVLASTDGAPEVGFHWTIRADGPIEASGSLLVAVEDVAGWRVLGRASGEAGLQMSADSFTTPAVVFLSSSAEERNPRGPGVAGSKEFSVVPADRVFSVPVDPLGRLSGVVSDEGGRPLGPGVSVVALFEHASATELERTDPLGHRWQVAETDAVGQFTFVGLSAAFRYRVSAAGLGFATEGVTMSPGVSADPVALTALPLFGIRLLVDSSAAGFQIPAKDLLAWEGATTIAYLPYGSLPPKSAGSPALTWLRLAQPDPGDLRDCGVIWRTSPISEPDPAVEVHCNVPGFVSRRDRLTLRRWDEAPAPAVIVLERSSDRFDDVWVHARLPPYAPGLPPQVNLGKLRFVNADGSYFQREVAAGDLLAGIFVERVPHSATGVKFVTRGGRARPSGPLPQPLQPHGDHRAALFDLTGLGALEFSIRHNDQSLFRGPVTVNLIEWSDSFLPPVGGTGPIRMEIEGDVEVYTFSQPPFLLPLLEPGKYAVSFHDTMKILSGRLTPVDVLPGVTRSQTIDLSPRR